MIRLRQMLTRRLDFRNIDRAIADGSLYAVAVSASGYTSGHSISFFQAPSDIEPWARMQRFGSRARLNVEHLMASAAIPFVFPAIRLHREWFGDGSMRPVGAVVSGHSPWRRESTRHRRRADVRENGTAAWESYPTLAQVAGHALSSIFLDGLAVDIERMQRINRTLAAIPDEVKQGAGMSLRPIGPWSSRLRSASTIWPRSMPRRCRARSACCCAASAP